MPDDITTVPVVENGENEVLDAIPNLSEIDPETATPEQVEQLKKVAQTALGQANHWKEKARKLADTKVTATPPSPVTKTDQDDDLRRNVAELLEEKEKRHFAHANGLDPEETDYVFAFAKGMNVPKDKVLDNPFVKNGLEALRSQKRVSDATPGPSSRQPIVEGKTFGQMSREEKAKNFGELVNGLARKQ